MMAAIRQSYTQQKYFGDNWLLVLTILLLSFGLVMMTSASIEIAQSQYGDLFFHFKRQIRFLLMGLMASGVILLIPVELWQRFSPLLMLAAFVMLVLVLVPGIGKTVNGSTRWLNLGFMSLQASEPAKLFVVIFMAHYLSKQNEFFVNTWKGFLIPFGLVAPVVLLLLMEPDFGASVVMLIAMFGMMFLAGAKLYKFIILFVMAAIGGGGLIWAEEYRWRRLMSFIQALSDPFNEDVVYGSGYQLAQALIAFGRGEWFGIGLGNSIQKIYFLPEAHTDFVFAIIAEELGLFSVILLVVAFIAFITRAMLIARKNERNDNYFAAYMAYGIAFLFTGQVLINIAVNIGLLPTKGLTLPFLSYGGSSLMICLVMVAMLLRIDIENEKSGLEKTSSKSRTRIKSSRP